MKKRRVRTDSSIRFAKAKKNILKAIPYVVFGLFSTNVGEAWRLSEGQDISSRFLSFILKIPEAFQNFLPSFHLFDLLIGAVFAGLLWIIVYVKRQNQKKQ